MYRFMFSFLTASFIWLPLLGSQPTRKQKIVLELSQAEGQLAFAGLHKEMKAAITKKPADDQLLTLYHRINAQKTDSFLAIMSLFEERLGVTPNAHLLAALHTTTINCMRTHLVKTYGEDFDIKKSASYCSWLTDFFIGKQSE